ncbi:VOC family protein [Natronosporangium hydrolyticum]|uniref:VOC family protein n=1 Tax=Natronosporangium hydrolyticum TaxID=2811111 RepID=A0A895YIU9_9ACTN|nr:VOC family protein [Natronosporangium hydrolyticum]QSB15293.1 VOC family protein [Natronosporangium hydrolyticum]
MRERDTYPAGVPCWVDLPSPDPQATARFYAGLFGWEISDPDLGGHLLARLDGSEVAGFGLLTSDDQAGAGWRTYLCVADAGETATAVGAAGGKVLREPHLTPGARVAICADPQGAVFGLWQADGLAGARLVNTAGAWNWSELKVRDPDPTMAFYQQVFGWQTDILDFGGQVAMMVRMPGYGDFLELVEPGIRERHGAGGAPPGFTDAVAWIERIDPEDDMTAPHWSVTFSVADAAATAARAEHLGGGIIVPPFDAGEGLVAVVSDPDGTIFAVNEYQPTEAG